MTKIAVLCYRKSTVSEWSFSARLLSVSLRVTACLAPGLAPDFAAAEDSAVQTASATIAPAIPNPLEIGPKLPAVAGAPVTAGEMAPKVTGEDAPFIPLIKGSGLEGWAVQEGKASAWRREGEMISCTSSAGGWLRTEQEYSDFRLRLEYRLQAGGNTGIGLRAPDRGNPTFTGLEVQLLDDSSTKYSGLRPDQYTGSVYYQVPASQKAVLKATGEWNLCEICCKGDHLTVMVNGELVNDVNLAHPEAAMEHPKGSFSLSQRPPIGHIALQSHSTRVDFRKIELQDLTVRTDSGLKYVEIAPGEGEPLQNGKTVTVHYVGQLIDGKRFTDTRDLGQPVTVPLQAVIPGWQEGLQGMKVGGKRRLIVPAALGYGAGGVTNVIPPDATLVFEVELCGYERS